MEAPTPEIQRLWDNFEDHKRGLARNLAYYEAEALPEHIGVAVPPQMRALLAHIGWSRTFLDSVEERLDIEGFRFANAGKADERLWSWWQSNNLDEASSWAHLETLIHGRSYAIISAPDPEDLLADQDTPVIQLKGPNEVWADLDPRNGSVRRAIQVVRTDGADSEEPDYITVYERNHTTGYQSFNGAWIEDFHIQHNLGIVPVVPLLNRKRLSDKVGMSEITKEIRSTSDAAARIMMVMQATAEIMAIPQRILFGVDAGVIGAEGTPAFEAYLARMLTFEDPEGKAQQFSAAELRNFTIVLDKLAQEMATYTGLPPQYFTITSENPASADAIRASESRLVKKAERKQRIFGGAWEKVMQVAILVMDGKLSPEARKLETRWRDANTPTYAAMADAVVKLATSITPDGRAVIPVRRAREDLKYSETEIEQMEKWDKETPSAVLAALVRPAPTREKEVA